MPPQRELASDPTYLTTASIVREITTLKELISSRLESMDKAVLLLQTVTTSSPTTKEVAIQVEEKFKAISHQMMERDNRLDRELLLRNEHLKQIGEAETKRIDAIRAVDVAAVGVANERATQQASVLAAQVVASAETLRALVASTASAVALQLQQLSNQLSDRLGSLEKAQYENKGSGSGMEKMWGWLFGAGMLIAAIASVAYAMNHK